MIEITSREQFNKIPEEDFILIIRKPHTDDTLHKSKCNTLDNFRNMMNDKMKKENPNVGNNFPRSNPYYHIKFDDDKILNEYKKCSQCIKTD